MSIYVKRLLYSSYSNTLHENKRRERSRVHNTEHNSSENIINIKSVEKRIDCKPEKYDSFKTIWSMHLHNEYNIHSICCCCCCCPSGACIVAVIDLFFTCISWHETRFGLVAFGVIPKCEQEQCSLEKDEVLWVHKTSLKQEKIVFASVVLFRFIGFAFVLSIFVVIYYFIRKS